jgi:ATP adenylyltransferase
MDRLTAPWRGSYVTGGVLSKGCVMCLAGEGDPDSAPLVIHHSELCVILANLYPYSSGHVMVAPRRHVGSLESATEAELADMMALARRLEQAFHATYHPDGLNVGMNLGRAAGAGIADHIHLHAVPRWAGDTNFMTVIGETRVVPEDPTEAAAKLRVHFR